MKSHKQKLRRRVAQVRGQALINRIQQWMEVENFIVEPGKETLESWKRTYLAIRDAGWRVNNEELVPLVAKEGMIFAAAELGMIGKHKTIILETEDESALLADFGIYNYRVNGKSLIQRYWEQHAATLSELETKWITGALKSRYTMLLLEDCVAEVGVWARDILTGDSLFVTDLNFSRTAVAGLTLASRITPIGDFYMTNGAPLPIFDDSVLAGIGEYLARSFTDVKDFRTLSPERSSWLEAFIIRTIRERQGTNRVRYANP